MYITTSTLFIVNLFFFSWVCNVAKQVVTTDFPDPALISNLEWNRDANLAPALRHRLVVKVSL
jgi:hypothetical protein